MIMIRTVLTFLLLGPEKLSSRLEKEWHKEHEAILKGLGARLADWTYTIEVTPAIARALLKLFKQWRKEGARVNGYGYSQELIDDDRTLVEWFTLHATGTDYEHFLNWREQLERPIEQLDDYPQGTPTG
jgi:hypothetical protein